MSIAFEPGAATPVRQATAPGIAPGIAPGPAPTIAPGIAAGYAPGFAPAVAPAMVAANAPAMAGPSFPTTPGEFITVLAHYHRAEIARMAGWRDRIDRTTNWAITVVAAMLSVSLSTPSAHHGVLLFAMVLVLLLLMIEARRYRFFDVYRARVRQLERNYFAQILAPLPEVDAGWARAVGEDLRRPLFQIGQREAMSRRLRRNYSWVFLILLVAWLLKVTSWMPATGAPPAGGALAWLEGSIGNAALGPLPGWLVLAVVALFYAWLLHATLVHDTGAGELAHGDVHV